MAKETKPKRITQKISRKRNTTRNTKRNTTRNTSPNSKRNTRRNTTRNEKKGLIFWGGRKSPEDVINIVSKNGRQVLETIKEKSTSHKKKSKRSSSSSSSSAATTTTNSTHETPDLVLSLYKLFLPLNDVFFNKDKKDDWIKNKLQYSTTLMINKNIKLYLPTIFDVRMYKTDTISENTLDIINKQKSKFMDYFMHFLNFLTFFPSDELFKTSYEQTFIVCGHSIYIRTLLEAIVTSDEKNIIKNLSNMNSFSITLDVKLSNSTHFKLLLIRHGHSCHNQIKQMSETKSNFVDKMYTNFSRAIKPEPKLSLYGTIGTIYLGTLLTELLPQQGLFSEIKHSSKQKVIHLFGSSLIRTWLTILLLTVPNITNKHVEKVHLHVSPFIKEVEIGSGNNRMPFLEQISTIIEYFTEFGQLVCFLNQYQSHFHQSPFFEKFLSTANKFFANLEKYPIIIESYLYDESIYARQEKEEQESSKQYKSKQDVIYAVKLSAKLQKTKTINEISIQHEYIDRIHLKVHDTLLKNTYNNNSSSSSSSSSRSSSRSSSKSLDLQNLQLFRGFPIPSNELLLDENITRYLCSEENIISTDLTNRDTTNELYQNMFSSD